MALDIHQIDDLIVTTYPKEYWDFVIENVKHNMNQVLNEKVQIILQKEILDIEFILDNDPNKPSLDNDPNACATKISTNKYQIHIGRKLLILLRHYSYKVIEYNLLFNDIARDSTNHRFFRKVSDSLFYFWMDFVCLHEWSHIVQGHLNYLEENDLLQNSTYFEFNTTNTLSLNKQILYLETDADRFASRILFGKMSSKIETIKSYLNQDTETILYNLFIGMFYLFDLFFLLKGTNKRSDHPSPIERMAIVSTGMNEALHMNPKLLDMSEKVLGNILEKSLKMLIIKHGSEYKIDSYLLAKQFPNLIESYIGFLDSKKINSYSYLK